MRLILLLVVVFFVVRWFWRRGSGAAPAEPGWGAYLADGLVRAGLVIGAVGCGPLLFVIAATDLGLTDDPNPNPIGFGILFTLCVWPTILCLGFGIRRVRRRARGA